MVKINCLNPIAKCGTDLFGAGYELTDNLNEADAVLVRSAVMHDLEVPDSLIAVARAGAGVNNIPLDKYAEKGIVVFNTPGANANGMGSTGIIGSFIESQAFKPKARQNLYSRPWTARAALACSSDLNR